MNAGQVLGWTACLLAGWSGVTLLWKGFVRTGVLVLAATGVMFLFTLVFLAATG